MNQASGDRKILCERLNISTQQAAHISNSGPGQGLIFFGNVILPFVDDFPRDNELYGIMTTRLSDISGQKQATMDAPEETVREPKTGGNNGIPENNDIQE